MSSERIAVGVLGATSHVGLPLLSILVNNGYRVYAFSRSDHKSIDGITWVNIEKLQPAVVAEFSHEIPYWISLLPIWTLPEFFPLIKQCRSKILVSLSTTSIFTKNQSSDLGEKSLVKKTEYAEFELNKWADESGVNWVILRPTLIYGYGRDKNVSSIMRFIKRFGFFPVFGQANGLRQPVHAEDVAMACVGALNTPNASGRSYNIAGAEVITYREMVCRIFAAAGRVPLIITVPLFLFKTVLSIVRILPRYRHMTHAMAERMNVDMVFECIEAKNYLSFNPRKFEP